MEESAPDRPGGPRREALVIAASSLGTVFEWYDFYLYGLLATVISSQFFSAVDENTGFIFALAAFAAGFAVRPFGALVFGRVGDLVGRKNTFLVTMGIMGASTFAVGLLPNYAAIGTLAPMLLVGLRLLQGLALGGQYGGAATYVAEHAPEGKRGFYTSWIQTTATLGLFGALLVVIGVRATIGEAAFATWGWRVPFLASALLLLVSLWIRLRLNESPVFQRMKAHGTTAKAPITESFGNWPNLRIVLIALFGAVAGQAVIWYTGQFYALFYLEKILKVDGASANVMIAVALVLGTPFFVLFGWLSDKVGRKPIIMTGCVLACIGYFPLFHALTAAANPALADAQARAPVVLVVNPKRCSLQFDPVGAQTFDRTACDVAKAWLARAGVPYDARAWADVGPMPDMVRVSVGETEVATFDSHELADPATRDETAARFRALLAGAVETAGYPQKADPAQVNAPLVVAILFLLVLIVTMVYGPIAAMLVELFPSHIRYTSMSLPYHVGNGWFGGFLPTAAFAMVAATGDIYFGLWYPVAVAAATLIVGLLFLPETAQRRLVD